MRVKNSITVPFIMALGLVYQRKTAHGPEERELQMVTGGGEIISDTEEDEGYPGPQSHPSQVHGA